MYITRQLPSATMELLKQFGDKHVSMETRGQQYNTTIYINFELGHTTLTSHNMNFTTRSSFYFANIGVGNYGNRKVS
jgi:hypothetical protein